MKFCVTLLLFCACCGSLVRGCIRGRRSPRLDTINPTITCPPSRHENADPFKDSTEVWWDESSIAAYDYRGRPIKPFREGIAPGKSFSEGVTTVKYHAIDTSGNYAFCIFKVTVQVLRCERLGDVADGWKKCEVSHDMRRGNICHFGCYGGYELVGPSSTKCLDTKEWDTATHPYCKKRTCDKLFPTSGQYGLVSIECTDGNYYRSMCRYNCAEGYSVLPGHNKVRVCNEFSHWRGSTPVCVDTKQPVYIDCPRYIKIGYAERSKTVGRVWWNEPKATDNSGSVMTTQISGPESGSDLEVGEYTVQYMARDANDNTAFCEFKVIIKQIKCHTIYPLPYTSVVCPNGRIYGSTCQFTCDGGALLHGPANSECDKVGSVIPYGAWTFSNHQPYCENQNTCPALRAPDNGALACDTWLYGRYCKMLCEDGYVVIDDPQTASDEVRIHQTLLVCGDSGNWYISANIPNCQEVAPIEVLKLRIDIDYLYYDGPCDEAKEVIKSKFIEAIKAAINETCQPPDCSVSNVKIICGERYGGTNRKRRDITSGFNFEVNLELSSNRSSTEIVKTRNVISNSLNAANIDIEINGTIRSPSAINISQPKGACTEGNAYNKKTFQCVKCSVGYFHDIKNGVCNPCARGYYQDHPRQSSCKPCPPGNTTKTRGAHSASQCAEACPAGYYSATGTPPCSACDLGRYNEEYGSTECTQCQGSQITLMAGAASRTQCKEFDVTYSNLKESDELSIASLNVEINDTSQFVFTFFVKCKLCRNMVNFTGTDRVILSITHTDEEVLVEYNGYEYKTGESIKGSMMWNQITVVITGAEMITYLNDRVVLNETLSNRTMPSVDTALNVTIGGEEFIGSVSQMNMLSDISAFTPIQTDTCFSTNQGDLINWRQFFELDGTFVLTKSICDVDNNCQSTPCQNDGLCTDSTGGFSCTCLDGYNGSACEVNIDDCLDNACDNNATCIDGVDSYTCACSQGFTGELCETHFVDGSWTAWETIGGCSVTCGSGWQHLSRVCENPSPLNGGKDCEGDNTTVVACETNTTCKNECVNVPTRLENGSMNCEWYDNETRVCKPTCNEEFDFDSDMFVNTSGIICGPETGYTWNINSTDNPFSQIPSCTSKMKALSNILNYTAGYPSLTAENFGLTADIKSKVNGRLKQIGCTVNGSCVLVDIFVFCSKTSVQKDLQDNDFVMFTIELKCDITAGMNECYDLLAEVVNALDAFVEELEFTIHYNGSDFDVGVNSTSLDGVSVCDLGHVPVWQYCVPCGKGTYATKDYCERCPRAYYQDEEAQTECKQCPEGWTTAALMTRDKEYCNIPFHIDDNSGTNLMTIGVIVAGSVVLGVVLIATTLILCKRQRLNLNAERISKIVKLKKLSMNKIPDINAECSKKRPWDEVMHELERRHCNNISRFPLRHIEGYDSTATVC